MAFGWSLPIGLKACTGVEVNIQTDGSFGVRVLRLSLQKKLIHIDDKKEYTVEPDKFKEVKIKGPLAVTLTGKGVLIKKTAKLESVTEQSLRHLFPNFKLAEFYVQHFKSGENSFIAFVRKEIADPILAALGKQGAEVLLFSLGPFVADQVIPQLNNYNGNLNFDGHQVILNEEQVWLDYNYAAGSSADFELKIDIEPIAGQFILPYAAAFQLILNDRLELIEVEVEEIKQALIELTSKLKFEKYGAVVLISFFALLMINFMVFSAYNSGNKELLDKVGQRTDLSSNKEKLEADIKEKETQVKQLGWNHGLNYAYLCDQIGQTVPASISLHELTINTIKDKNISVSRKNEVDETGSLRIIGQSASMYVINDWIYALKLKSWVKSVRLEKYATDDQKGIQVFTLLLNY